MALTVGGGAAKLSGEQHERSASGSATDERTATLVVTEK